MGGGVVSAILDLDEAGIWFGVTPEGTVRLGGERGGLWRLTGAHTLDYLPHALQVMAEIADAVGGKAILIADGGFRRGSDVIKGLALGASLVGLGRPILYGLAAEGREGVRDLIDQITEEMKRIMSLIGAEAPGKLTKDMLIEDP